MSMKSSHLHEFRHNILLFLIVTCRQTHFLLTLIIHHFLHQGSCFAIQVWEFRRFRIDFFSWHCRIRSNQLVPPWHLIDFLQRNDDCVFVDCPKRIFRFNFCVQFSVNDGRLILKSEFQSFFADDTNNVTRLEAGNVAEWHTKLKKQILIKKIAWTFTENLLRVPAASESSGTFQDRSHFLHLVSALPSQFRQHLRRLHRPVALILPVQVFWEFCWFV